ncbi:amino acid transporter [Pseudooceanicola sediminis]|uniref:Amino acid transporter n=1 Tax=Pseudooceanicola sediminis TaxID=2211117 RepID=A0A399IVS6_9RHOB|nr:LysE/ArgO family amino acid transporter [Pseudooceanicola sediminis]KAA2311579.1 amino acid transporter [Puniceibacterium sp. HSS470]RII37050.1 amino acid transporter [Pseudooceanicola sediminis]|tara:strand:- start:39281 stop:39892 length:612 start_codon:yes stop_codon:yes gene_type:complete
MNFYVFLTGIMMSLGLIVAIGAQNAFVLRQGLRGEHVLAVCLACALSDAVLITIGVTSFQTVSDWLPLLEPIMRYGGAAFLIWYGVRSFLSALRSNATLEAASSDGVSDMMRTLIACLAITWLNPHVYLDTVVLLGTISTQFGSDTASFALGAILGSFIFFFALGYGATWLRPVFESPTAWRILEMVIALVMWTIAATLLVGS